jgi:hypothetical protein
MTGKWSNDDFKESIPGNGRGISYMPFPAGSIGIDKDHY